MNDALFVRGFQRLGDLTCDGESLGDRYRPAGDVRGQVLALDQFHHERDGGSCRGGPCARPFAVFGKGAHNGSVKGTHEGCPYVLQSIDGRDVGMIHRREGLRLACESRQPFPVARERRGEHLDRDVAVELGVAGAKHLAHPTRANGVHDLIRSEPRAGNDGHGLAEEQVQKRVALEVVV